MLCKTHSKILIAKRLEQPITPSVGRFFITLRICCAPIKTLIKLSSKVWSRFKVWHDEIARVSEFIKIFIKVAQETERKNIMALKINFLFHLNCFSVKDCLFHHFQNNGIIMSFMLFHFLINSSLKLIIVI